MKFSIRFSDQIVGTLVVLALAILVFVVFMLGKSQRWFVQDYQYKTYLTSASGLSANMAVQFKGFTIGHVKDFSLTEEDTVQVIFTIFEEHRYRVTEGSLVHLFASPIGLGNSFIFFPGLGTEELPEGSVIPEAASQEAKDLIAKGLTSSPETNDSIGNIISNVEQITNELNKLVKDLNNNFNPILADVKDITEGVSRQISPILENVQTLTDQLAEPSGTVMSLLDNEGPLLDNITEILNSLSGIMESLDKVVEFVPSQLPQIMLLLSQVNSALVDAQKLIVALNNNPLLRGGVPALNEAGPGAATPRNLEF